MKFLNFTRKKPNVIMILMDGIREDCLLAHPFYNELRKSSVFFPNMITYAPYTIGSLHAIFSGLYGNTNGVDGYYKSYNFDKKNCFTLAQYLKEAGYYTECDVPIADLLPTQGFDKVRTYDRYEKEMTDRHAEILTQVKDRAPFLLFIRYGEVYANTVSEIIKKYSDFDEQYFSNKDNNLKMYNEWVEKSAAYLKIVLDKIKELNLHKNSIILIFSDHGCSVGDKKGEKAYGVFLYDYTLKSFLYVFEPNIPEGLGIKSVIRNIDIMPTILEILGVKEKQGFKKLQGKSFMGMLKGSKEERLAYSETGGLGGPNPSPEKHNLMAVRTNKWKLIYNETTKKRELYDLENDPEEKRNLAGKNLEIEVILWDEMEKLRNTFTEEAKNQQK